MKHFLFTIFFVTFLLWAMCRETVTSVFGEYYVRACVLCISSNCVRGFLLSFHSSVSSVYSAT